MQMEALVWKQRRDTTAFSQAGEGDGGEGVWKDEKGGKGVWAEKESLYSDLPRTGSATGSGGAGHGGEEKVVVVVGFQRAVG